MAKFSHAEKIFNKTKRKQVNIKKINTINDNY